MHFQLNLNTNTERMNSLNIDYWCSHNIMLDDTNGSHFIYRDMVYRMLKNWNIFNIYTYPQLYISKAALSLHLTCKENPKNEITLF